MPKAPGGYLDYPPTDCEKAVTYCPNPELYEVLRIVDYVLCCFCCPRQKAEHCQRKQEEDAGTKRRILLQKNGKNPELPPLPPTQDNISTNEQDED
jgi:hypothetical protein